MIVDVEDECVGQAADVVEPASGEIALDEKERKSLERFFCDAVADTNKLLHILGWRGAAAAAEEVERVCRRFLKAAAE